LWFVASLLVGIGLGFLIAHLLNRRGLREMGREMEELRWRLANAESVVSASRNRAWKGGQAGSETFPDEDEDEGDEPSTLRIEYESVQDSLRPEVEGCDSQVGPKSPATSSSGNRRVRVTKILGPHAKFRIHDSFEGVEEAPPVARQRYRVRTDCDAVIRTSPVLNVSLPYIQTLNSVYRIEPLQDGGTSSPADPSEKGLG
jgi:hypothetical protein